MTQQKDKQRFVLRHRRSAGAGTHNTTADHTIWSLQKLTTESTSSQQTEEIQSNKTVQELKYSL